jgi:hypothetical protein
MSSYLRLAASFVAALTFATSNAIFAAPYTTGDVCDDDTALKIAYLRCEDLAQDGALSRSGIAECSEIYEMLKHRVFEGSFSALRIWYEQTEKLDGRSSKEVGRPIELARGDC